MRGIILAGGKGTRLYPLTKVTNKHLLPVGKKPMIFNPIKQLVSAGIKEILVVTSTEHMGVYCQHKLYPGHGKSWLPDEISQVQKFFATRCNLIADFKIDFWGTGEAPKGSITKIYAVRR